MDSIKQFGQALRLFPSVALACAYFVLFQNQFALAVQSSENYQLEIQQKILFAVKGHVVLRKLLPQLAHMRAQIKDAKKKSDLIFYEYALRTMECPSSKSTGAEKNVSKLKKAVRACKREKKDAVFPYYQNINIHRLNKDINQLATSEYLGKTAASLLQVPSVRLYQTALFFKDPSDLNQATGWHTDLNQIPVDTYHYLTFWCPLKPIEFTDSVLVFASHSHRDASYRHWYTSEPKDMGRLLEERYQLEHYAPFSLGDCSVHSGWVYHKASPNHGDDTREAIAFSYVAADARKLHSNDIRQSRAMPTEDELSWRDWFHSIGEHEVIDSPLLPIVYSPEIEIRYQKHKKKEKQVLYYTTVSLNDDIDDDLEWQAIFDEDDDWWVGGDLTF